MDVSDITKVVSRKRIREDAEQLREKVSRETEKIIKLKVAQDTAYWDLKEKLQQVEANHERLQQNMVEVQMQHEAVSGQFQDELRLRPETANKVQGAVRVCAATERGAGRVRAAGARGEADRVALGAALREAARRVRTLRDQLGADLAALTHAQQQAQHSLSVAVEGRCRAERDAGEARTRCDVTRTDLVRARDDVTQKNELIESLKKEMEQLKQDLRVQSAEAEKTIGKLVEGVRQGSDSCATLERRLAAAAEQCDALRDDKERLQQLLQESQVALENSQRTVEELKEKNDIQQQTIEKQNESLRELEGVRGELRALEGERARLQVEAEQQAQRVQRDHDTLCALRDQLAHTEQQYSAHREESAAREAAAGASVAALMRDLRDQTERRHKLDDALQAAREHTHQQHALLADKEDELNKQMAVILDMRNEKERLQEKIQTMQNTIDNIQKEVSGGGGGGGCGVKGEEPQQDSAPPRPAPPLDAALYSFMSDDSTDANTLDAGEVRRRFEALRGDARRTHRYLQSPISLSQARSDLKTKFFKNKRMESKLKKQK